MKKLIFILLLAFDFSISQSPEIIPIPRRFTDSVFNPYFLRPCPSGRWAYIYDSFNRGRSDTVWLFNMSSYVAVPITTGDPNLVPDSFGGWAGDSLIVWSVLDSTGRIATYYKLNVWNITQSSAILPKTASRSRLLSANRIGDVVNISFPGSSESELLISYPNGRLILSKKISGFGFNWNIKQVPANGVVFLSLFQGGVIYSMALNLNDGN